MQFYHVVLDPVQTADSSVTPWPFQGFSGRTPAQIRMAYGIDSIKLDSVVGDGTGQTIAIVDAYDDPALLNSDDPSFISSDLHVFDDHYGLADPPSFHKLGQDGGAGLPAASAIGGWSVEEALDVEWAHAIAPGASIVLVEANSDSSSDMMAAVDTARNLPGVSVVSMSFGGSESEDESDNDPIFTTPADHSGVTFVAAAGDDGASGGFIPGSYPACSPNVVSVGGTSLTFAANPLRYYRESGWTYGGGGESWYETEPVCQKSVQSSGWRQTPDVAFVADPGTGVSVYDSYDYASQPWRVIGGTSLSAPCWAGLIAIANQLRASEGQPSLDGATQTLPWLYQLPASDFHDITSGSNGCTAGPGYDMVTGRGTPIANLLVPDLARQSASCGMVSFTALQYEIGTAATVVVSDGDLKGDTTCQVTVTSSAGDSETVTLTVDDSGFFRGTIATSDGAVTENDGTLQVVPGTDAITVTYNDADDGSGSAATVTDHAVMFYPLTITSPVVLPTAIVGEPYSFTFSAINGVGGYTWSGDLVEGLSLDPTTGVLTGSESYPGDYYVWITVVDAGSPQNWTTIEATLPFEIFTPTINVSMSASRKDAHGNYTYDGSPFAATTTMIGPDGNPTSTLGGVGATCMYYSTWTPNAPGTAVTPTSPGTYKVVASYAGSGGYAAAESAPMYFTIEPAMPTLSLSVASGTYNGLPFAATATVAGIDGIAGSSLEGSVVACYYRDSDGYWLDDAPTTPGTYTAWASIDGSRNYYWANTDPVSFTIARAQPAVSVADTGGTYTGTPFAATATVTGVDGVPTSSLDGVSPTFTYYVGTTVNDDGSSVVPIEAGVYTVVASFADSTNYVAAQSSPITFTIAPANPAVSISDAGGTYDGSPFTATATVTGVDGIATSSLAGVSPTIT